LALDTMAGSEDAGFSVSPMEVSLSIVDAVPPLRVSILCLVLANVGLLYRAAFVGIIEAVLDTIGGFGDWLLPEKAFLRRAVRLANVVVPQNIRISQPIENVVQAKSSFQLPVPPTCDFSDTVGSEFSASALAKMLASGSGDIDVAALIVRANIGMTSFHMQCDMNVYKIMESENISAEKTPKRQAFSYIVLTAAAVLPLWLPADAIGGSASFQTDITDSSTVSLAAIGKALQAATSQKKIFRTHAQWLGCFTKYALAEVATSQLTFAQVLTYLNTLSRLQEAEPTKKFFVMVLYDDLFRRTLARRAEARDPGLVLDSEFCVIDKQILETCRNRVDSVMVAHGLHENAKAPAKSLGGAFTR
jgi:hypothetical protein